MTYFCTLIRWGQMTHIRVCELPIIGSDNGLLPGRRQTIIWTDVGILLIRTFRTNFSEILRKIHTFSFKKMHLKMSTGKRRPFCLGLNVLNHTFAALQYRITWTWMKAVTPGQGINWSTPKDIILNHIQQMCSSEMLLLKLFKCLFNKSVTKDFLNT